MRSDAYLTRVLLKPESGMGDSGGQMLVGSAADLRAVLEDLLAAVERLDAATGDPRRLAHNVVVGDASGRWDHTYIGVHLDADVAGHHRNTRWLWRIYDSNVLGLIALVVLLLAIVGARTVWRWFAGV